LGQCPPPPPGCFVSLLALCCVTDNALTTTDAFGVCSLVPQDWYSFVTLQQGHNILYPVTHWQDQYRAQPPRPVLEDEANYEQVCVCVCDLAMDL
jgi:hypothetical protein